MSKGTLNILISVMAFLVVITLVSIELPKEASAMIHFLRFIACAVTMIFAIIITSCKKITDED